MIREKGCYWVVPTDYAEPVVIYYDGESWHFQGLVVPDNYFHAIVESRLPTPGELEGQILVPRDAWGQALNAEVAINAGDEGSAKAALAKMRRLLEKSA